jgi:hypothetical protein
MSTGFGVIGFNRGRGGAQASSARGDHYFTVTVAALLFSLPTVTTSG